MKWLLITTFTFGISTAALAQKGCDYAGQAFSIGATVCECPSLKAEDLNWQGEKGTITSRRLVCGQGMTWEDTKTMCIDTQMATGTEKTYTKLMDHYCPRLPVNFAEIQKATRSGSRWVAPPLSSLSAVAMGHRSEASFWPFRPSSAQAQR
jgi:hypothetical protein